MGWTLAYHHDENGNPISGTKIKDLIDAVLNGHDVKVLVMDDKRGHSYIFKTDFVFASNDGSFVCGQNPYGGVSVDQDQDRTLKWKDEDSVEGGLYNWMVIACTKGYLDITRPLLGSPERCKGKEHTREYHKMKWFIDRLIDQ